MQEGPSAMRAMTVAALPTWAPPIRGEQACARTLGPSQRFPSLQTRHTFGSPSDHASSIRKRIQCSFQLWSAADYPDSKPDASTYLANLGYHPLEEIPTLQKKTIVDLIERRLPDAEIARTLAEANETAILFYSLWDDQDHIFGTEVEYIIDERGDIYIQIDDDSDFLSTLDNARTKMNMAIGYESIEEWILEQQKISDSPAPQETEDNDLDSDGGQEESWAIITADGDEYIIEEIVEEQESPEETLGNWSGLDTLAGIHPLDFASALSAAALADDSAKFEKPSQSLRIAGEVRRLNEQEEKYVRKLCEERFTDEPGGEEEEDTDDETEDSTEISGELLQETGADGGEDELEGGEAGMSIYKLDIESIHVISYFRTETTVDSSDFQAAKPDILALAGPEMVDRLSSRGKVLEDALKVTCLHRRGLIVEEATLLLIDSLGMDLRVHSGREIQTVRICFSQRATSVEHAEQLVNQLLFPEVPLRGPKRCRSRPQGKSTDRS